MSKYVEILFRYRLRFVILLIILPAELAVACIFLYPHQTAASSMWVDTPAYISIATTASGWNQYLTPAQNTVDALNQLRSTDSFVQTVATKLDATQTFRDAGERDSVLATVTSDVGIFPSGSHLVGLTYTCPHEPICSNVLTATEQIYRQWLIDQETAQANVAIDFYSGQLTDAQTKLTSDVAALTAYLAAHPSVKYTDASLNPEFDQLLRNANNDRSSVAAFQQKIDDIKLANAAATSTTDTVLKVIDQPRTTGGRFTALPRKQMAIAAIASLAVAVAMLVFMAWTDRTTREPRELEHILKLPVVVTIPDLALMEETASG